MARLSKILQTSHRAKTTLADNKINHINVDNENVKKYVNEDDLVKKGESAKAVEQMDVDSPIAPDLRSITNAGRYIENADEQYKALLNETESTYLDVASLTNEGTVYCAKTGRKMFSLNDDELLDQYACIENSVNAEIHTLGVFSNTIAPHIINGGPEALDKLRIVDPCGLFVWLSSLLAGTSKRSFDKQQWKTKVWRERMVFVQERAAAYSIIREYMNETNTNAVKIAVCNDFMLKILAVTDHKNLYRNHKSLKVKFYSLTNAAKAINEWGDWLKDVNLLIGERLMRPTSDSTEQGILRKAELQNGNTAARLCVTRDLRQDKRQWLERLGIKMVLTNTILDTISAKELEMPVNVDHWDIQKLNDGDLRNKVHNRLVVKTSKSVKDLRNASERQVKKLKRDVEIADFIDMADIKAQGVA